MADQDDKGKKQRPKKGEDKIPPPPKIPERGMLLTDADRLPPPPKQPEKGMKVIASDLRDKKKERLNAVGVGTKSEEKE